MAKFFAIRDWRFLNYIFDSTLMSEDYALVLITQVVEDKIKVEIVSIGAL